MPLSDSLSQALNCREHILRLTCQQMTTKLLALPSPCALYPCQILSHINRGMLPGDGFPAAGKVTLLPEKSPVVTSPSEGPGVVGLAGNNTEGRESRAGQAQGWINPFLLFPWHPLEPTSQHHLQLRLAKGLSFGQYNVCLAQILGLMHGCLQLMLLHGFSPSTVWMSKCTVTLGAACWRWWSHRTERVSGLLLGGKPIRNTHFGWYRMEK